MIFLRSVLIILFAAIFSPGCAMFESPQRLVFQQKTVLGVDVAPSPDAGSVHLVAGYKRRTNSFVPTAELTDENGEQTREAMSVIALTKVKVSFWRLPEIHECFATGEAAINIAASEQKITGLRACYPSEDHQKEDDGGTN